MKKRKEKTLQEGDLYYQKLIKTKTIIQQSVQSIFLDYIYIVTIALLSISDWPGHVEVRYWGNHKHESLVNSLTVSQSSRPVFTSTSPFLLSLAAAWSISWGLSSLSSLCCQSRKLGHSDTSLGSGNTYLGQTPSGQWWLWRLWRLWCNTMTQFTQTSHPRLSPQSS